MVLRMARPTRRKSSNFEQSRHRVPADLRGRANGFKVIVEFPATATDPAHTVGATIGANEVAFSLRTRDPATAKARKGLANAHLEAMFARLRADAAVTLTTRQAVALAGDVYKAITEAFEDTPELAHDHTGDGGPDDRTVTLRDVARDPNMARTIAAAALTRRGLPRVANVEAIAEAVAAAIRDAEGTLKRRLDGDYSPDQTLARFPVFVPPPVPARAVKATKTRPVKNLKAAPTKRVLIPGNPRKAKPVPVAWADGEPSWGALTDAWQARHRAARRSSTTRDQWIAFFRRFATWYGKPPGELARHDVNRWVENRLAAGISASTVKTSDIVNLSALFNAAITADLLPETHVNPTKRVAVPQLDGAAQGATNPEQGYSDHASALILAAAQREDRPLFRWCPLLLAMTGARSAEVIQLRACDVRVIDGRPCIDITPDAGRLKNVGSRRVVPLHPLIITGGFLDYVATKTGTDRLFIRSRDAEDVERPARTTVNQLSRWVRSVPGLVTGRKVGLSPVHAFRHAFNTRCRDAGVDSEVLHAICGHAPATVGAGYGSFSVAVKAAAIARLTGPTTHIGLSSHQPSCQLVHPSV